MDWGTPRLVAGKGLLILMVGTEMMKMAEGTGMLKMAEGTGMLKMVMGTDMWTTMAGTKMRTTVADKGMMMVEGMEVLKMVGQGRKLVASKRSLIAQTVLHMVEQMEHKSLVAFVTARRLKIILQL